ncbi:hypothetical protein EON65_00035 [archaeon]|nr:MAG: hypothetical protein EON65_00035 [archaeon]
MVYLWFSVPTSAGKYPLHLALSNLTDQQDDDEFFHHVIKRILVLYPQAASIEVTEELRCMRLRINPQGILHNPDEDRAVGNVYTMQVHKCTWSPIDRVRGCGDNKVSRSDKLLIISFLAY